MLRGVIFDMDGVVIDSHPTHMRVWKKFLHLVGKEVSGRELEFILDGRKKVEILRHFLGDLPDEMVRAYSSQTAQLFEEEALQIKLLTGLPQFLNELDDVGISMALATSASQSRVDLILDQLRLRQRFQAIVTGDDVVHGKPDPAIFRMAAERLHALPNELLVIEDAVSGVKAAKAAGMKCLAIAQNHRIDLLLRAGADEVVPDFLAVSTRRIRRLWD